MTKLVICEKKKNFQKQLLTARVIQLHTETHIPPLAHENVVSGSSTFTLTFGRNYHLAQQGKTQNGKRQFTMSLITHLTSSQHALILAVTAKDKEIGLIHFQ